MDHLLRPVDPYRPHAPAQRRAGGREGRHLRRVPAGQDLREEDPVVGGVLLLTEDADVPAQPGGEPQAGEAAADHHHALLFRGHDTRVRGRCFPTASPLFPRRNLDLSVRVKGP